MAKKIDTYSYKGWLTSDNIFKRGFAVFGYWWLGYLIIMVPFIIVASVLMYIFPLPA